MYSSGGDNGNFNLIRSQDKSYNCFTAVYRVIDARQLTILGAAVDVDIFGKIHHL
jgi:hypothetical protein